jgi:hypothetical protein
MDPAANLYPRAEDGLRSMAAVFAVAESGKADGVGSTRGRRCSAKCRPIWSKMFHGL